MEYSRKIEREISENGIEFDMGSVYARLNKLTDIRKAKGKRYSLTTLLMIILMAKLCGENTALGIADWAKKPTGRVGQDTLFETINDAKP